MFYELILPIVASVGRETKANRYAFFSIISTGTYGVCGSERHTD